MPDQRPRQGDGRATIVGIFDRGTDPASIMDSLRDVDGSAEMMTDHPVPAGETTETAAARLVPLAIVSGLIGIGIGVFFAGGTAVLYPIVTGGKPILAWPVVGIVSYETMMLCAIIATFGGLVLKLVLERKPGRVDPRVHEGAIAVALQVEKEEGSIQKARDRLRKAGAVEVAVR